MRVNTNTQFYTQGQTPMDFVHACVSCWSLYIFLRAICKQYARACKSVCVCVCVCEACFLHAQPEIAINPSRCYTSPSKHYICLHTFTHLVTRVLNVCFATPLG